MRITRRQVLATMSVAAAAGAIGAGATALRWWDRPPGDGLKVLSPDEHAFVQALAEAWMPRGGVPELSGRDARIGDFMDQTLEPMNPLTRKLLKLLMQVLDDSTLPTHLAAYRDIRLKERQRVLRGWMHHDNGLVRMAVQALLVLVSIGWTTHPDVVDVIDDSMRCAYGR